MVNQNKILEKENNRAVIDLKMLPKEEGGILIEFIEFLKRRQIRSRVERKAEKRRIKFQDWNLNTQGKTTRKEIYGYL